MGRRERERRREIWIEKNGGIKKKDRGGVSGTDAEHEEGHALIRFCQESDQRKAKRRSSPSLKSN